MSPHTCFPCVRSVQARRKKVTKERAPLLSATPALRYGATWGTRSRGAPFFWVLFFGEAKNKYLGRRAETRLPH
jgi:hypothetical protein